MTLSNFLHGTYPVSQPYGINNPALEPLIYPAPGGGLWFNAARSVDAGHWHAGIDYAIPSGTALYAPAEAIVTFAGWDDTGFGRCVQMCHGLFHGAMIYTLYAHLALISCRQGLELKQADKFAVTDSSGNSTAPHLHFAVFTMLDGWQVFHDPAPYFVANAPHPSTLKPKEGQHGH